MLNRREFMALGSLGAVAMWAAPMGWAAQRGGLSRALVLVELKGGNDGLNTVIPYRDKAYYAARPGLAIGRDRVLQLSSQVGFHPALEPLMKAWRADELAVVQGVGYENPNRSHFRSIAIWETGADSDEQLAQGWLARLLRGKVPAEHLAAGAVFDGDNLGPLEGEARTLVMNQPEQFIRQARALSSVKAPSGANDALKHVLGVQNDVVRGASVLEARLKRASARLSGFPRGAFARQLREAARLIIAEVPVAVIKVSLGGFDTHANQLGGHQRLLTQLAEGLAAFRAALLEAGAWDRVMVSTYSEFGRRVVENGSGGTDHGTAAPHLIMGGKVRGGLFGRQPSLTDLQNGDLKHHVDYRRLYATFGQRWWGLDAADGHKPLGFV